MINELQIAIILIIGIAILVFTASKKGSRKKHYRNVYLKSEKWKKQRNRVFRRDNWTCVYCPGKAQEVHHKRYAKKFGNEPDHWLVSVCKSCHRKIHKQRL